MVYRAGQPKHEPFKQAMEPVSSEVFFVYVRTETITIITILGIFFVLDNTKWYILSVMKDLKF